MNLKSRIFNLLGIGRNASGNASVNANGKQKATHIPSEQRKKCKSCKYFNSIGCDMGVKHVNPQSIVCNKYEKRRKRL